jgi:hypothetical protein
MTGPSFRFVQRGGTIVDVLFRGDLATTGVGEIAGLRNSVATMTAKYESIPLRAPAGKDFLPSINEANRIATSIIPLAVDSRSISMGFDEGDVVHLHGRANDTPSILRAAEPKSDMATRVAHLEASPGRGRLTCVPEPEALALMLVGVLASLVRRWRGRDLKHVWKG